LGKWATIESKQQSRLWHAFLAQEIAAFSYFEIRVPLNGAQMGHTVLAPQEFWMPAEPAGSNTLTTTHNQF
jgi:hypothetical protein